MGNLSRHWSFWERCKWLWSGESPNRDVLSAERERLRIEEAEKQLELIDLMAMQKARHEKISYLEGSP